MNKVKKLITAGFIAAGVLVASTTPAQAATPVRVLANFSSPKTDGLSKVTGQVVVKQKDGGTIYVIGKVSGLPAWSAFVAVPYIGKGCIPVPGVLAFPSTPFVTDANGVGRIYTTVNPKAINPLGQFTAGQTGSVSIRGVIFPARSVPGTNLGTPTLPNVAAVEACDSNPKRIS